MKKIKLLAALISLVALGLPGRAQDQAAAADSGVKGVNPAENLTKFELLPKYSRVDDDNDVTVSVFTVKYDRAIKGVYGLNVELPLTQFKSPLAKDNGLGDLNVRGRRQFRAGRWTYIVGAEAVLPVATEKTLGAGKVQLNPSGVAVYALSAQTFVAGVAKHSFSVAGPSDRSDIVQGQYRLLLAHSTKSGWWFLADPQFVVDYDRGARAQLSCEFEVGKMVRPLTGMWLRAGSRLGGNWHKEDWSVSAGIRFISF